MTDALALLDRAADAGYNGVVLTDSKFMRWDQLPAKYLTNVRRVREACRAHTSGVYRLRLPDRLQQRSAGPRPEPSRRVAGPRRAVSSPGGRLIPADRSARLRNGGFEQSKNHQPDGWSFVDQPGKIAFIDSGIHSEGGCSLRMQDIAHCTIRNSATARVSKAHGRALPLLPRVGDGQNAEVRVGRRGADRRARRRGVALNYDKPHVEKTQDWKRIDITFNSLEFSEVNLYLGVWGGRRGRIWWDDVRLEPGGLVNVVRRDGAATGHQRRRPDRLREGPISRTPAIPSWAGPVGRRFQRLARSAGHRDSRGQPHPRRPNGAAELFSYCGH